MDNKMFLVLCLFIGGINLGRGSIDINNIGCFDDRVSSLNAIQVQLRPDVLTPEICAKICAGFSYFGLENGRLCSCDNDLDHTANTSLTNCNVPCGGNQNIMCGGHSFNTIYKIECVPVANYSDLENLGCYVDTGTRDLNGSVVTSDDMTVEICAHVCANLNFLYMGVQFSTQCFCGNTYGLYNQGDDCNKACGGNPSQICGGTWRNTVYELNAVSSGCDGEPHFMLVSDHTHFCFSLHGKDDEIFNVITDPVRDIYVRGSTFEITVEDSLLSYFSGIGVTIGYGENKQTMVFDRDGFQINDASYDYDDEFHTFVSENVKVTLIKTHPYKYLIEIDNDISLVVSRATNPRVGNFLGIYVLKNEGFSKNLGGLLGQFLHTKFKVIEETDTTMIKFDDDHETVSVSKIPMFMPSTKKPIDCYFYFGVQRGGLIGDKSLYQENTLL